MPAEATPLEETLWKVVAGHPTPEELAAVTVVLSLLHHRAEEHSTPAPVLPLARWRHPASPRPAGSWRASERMAS
ncbi:MULTISPECIES: acyl-CoA carboxylase epsilon subunit [Streptomyces]|uniref:Acyl-CoA carboxylase epsilon subunit n=1 Tax=Streptomyces lienomycini TaxID=284035 RepID=A0ABV9WVV2_9ACTN|nr:MULTISPECIES: acyl-CoA carboxylase epsilon subunit [Streptomyces]